MASTSRPGALNGRAVLTAADVRKIRRRYERSYIPYTDMAKVYGCTPDNIRAIVLRRTWRHL